MILDIVSGCTHMLFLQEVERMYFSVRVLHSSWQLKYSSCVSLFNSKSNSMNCCSRSVSSETLCVPVFSVLDVGLSNCF